MQVIILKYAHKWKFLHLYKLFKNFRYIIKRNFKLSNPKIKKEQKNASLNYYNLIFLNFV